MMMTQQQLAAQQQQVAQQLAAQQQQSAQNINALVEQFTAFREEIAQRIDGPPSPASSAVHGPHRPDDDDSYRSADSRQTSVRVDSAAPTLLPSGKSKNYNAFLKRVEKFLFHLRDDEDVVEWLAQVERVRKALDANEEDVRCALPLLLRENALTFYSEWQKLLLVEPDWITTRQWLMSKFKPQGKVNRKVNAYMTHKQGPKTSGLTYYRELVQLLAYLDNPGGTESLKARFTAGLHEEIRVLLERSVVTAPNMSLDEYMEAAVSLAETMKRPVAAVPLRHQPRSQIED